MAYVKMVNSELYPEPLFQSEAKCEAIEMTATLLMQIKLIHKKGFALMLVLKVRIFGTRKWAIYYCSVLRCKEPSKLTTRERLDNCQFY